MFKKTKHIYFKIVILTNMVELFHIYKIYIRSIYKCKIHFSIPFVKGKRPLKMLADGERDKKIIYYIYSLHMP